MDKTADFLLKLLNIHLKDEWKTCDDKEWIKRIIDAKAWVYKHMRGGLDLIRAMEIQSDIDTYLKDK